MDNYTITKLKAKFDLEIAQNSKVTLNQNVLSAKKNLDFAATLPDGKLILTNARVVLKENTSVKILEVTGNPEFDWMVSGISGRGITAVTVSLFYTEAESTITDSTITFEGTLIIGEQPIICQGALIEDGRLHFVLKNDQEIHLPLPDIANFVSSSRMTVNYVPQGVELFTSIPITAVDLTFGLAYTAATYLSLTSDVGGPWKFIEGEGFNFQPLEKVGIRLFSTYIVYPNFQVRKTFGGDIYADFLLAKHNVEIRLAFNATNSWEIDILPKSGGSLPGLLDLADALNIKTNVQTALNTLNLGDISVVGIAIGFNPSTRKFLYFSIAGRVQIIDVDFDLFIRLPDFQFGGGLARGSTISFRKIVAHFFSAADNFPDIIVEEFALTAQPSAGTYSLTINLREEGFTLGPVTLEGVDLIIDKTSQGFDGSISATFEFAKSTIYVSAKHPIPNEGWLFTGESAQGQPIEIGDVIFDIAKSFKVEVPNLLHDIELENLFVQLDTKSQDFMFRVTGRFQGSSKSVEISVALAHQPDNSFKQDIKIKIGSLEFTLHFIEGNTSSVLIATYSHTGDPQRLPIKELIEYASSNPDLLKLVESLEIDLKDALFVYDKEQTADSGNKPLRKYLFGLDIGTNINLSSLTLVGREFPPEQTVGVNDLQLLIASKDFTRQEITTLNNLIPQSITQLPEPPTTDNNATNNETTVALPKGLNVAAKVKFSSTTDTLALPVSAATQPTSPNQPSPPAPTSTSISDNVTWFRLQKTFGPVHFERVGVQYKDAAIWFLLDAALSAAGLTLSLEGLCVGSPLSKFEPKFNLRGLGIDYKNGPIEIGGAFLKGKITFEGKEYEDYSGTAIIRTETLTLAAIGSYLQLDIGPSMFVYAVLDYPIGGPAFFFVTGLAAGFGYNRLLRLPPVDQIDTFPLVQEAVAGLAGTPNLADELAKLQQYIPPSIGNYFLAIGIRFTSFKMIDSFILVTAKFGHRLELDVVGLSTLVLPAPDAASTRVTPIAEVQLALRGTFIPDDGFFGISAQLTNNSFLLDRKCHLTGGFAFYTWFSGIYEGDFVLTVGGYHPQFSRPEHYPTVPRLSFNWQVDDHLTFKGNAYYALTPSALMAGCSLSATWQDGSLEAWFDAEINFLISWKPYHYEADFHLSIGASYTFSFFGTHHITAPLDADMSIWGPEFAGKAHITWSIISFTISFGNSSRNQLNPLLWDEFRRSFLPDDKICTINLKAGLIARQAAKDKNDTQQTDSEDLGIVNPKTLCLTTDSVIPMQRAYSGTGQTELGYAGATTAFNIGTMQLSNDQIISTQRIIITHNGISVEEQFDFHPLTKNAPAALWGRQLQPSFQADQLIKNLLTGYEIRAKRLDDAPHTNSINYAGLQQAATLDDERDAFRWSSLIPFVPQATDNATARGETIRNTLYDNDVASKRAAIASALLGETLNLANFSANDFLSAPQVNQLIAR